MARSAERIDNTRGTVRPDFVAGPLLRVRSADKQKSSSSRPEIQNQDDWRERRFLPPSADSQSRADCGCNEMVHRRSALQNADSYREQYRCVNKSPPMSATQRLEKRGTHQPGSRFVQTGPSRDCRAQSTARSNVEARR